MTLSTNRKIISLILFLLPVLSFAQGNVVIRCSFSSAAGDSCLIRPAEYFIDEFEKTYKAVIKNNQCDFSFRITKPTVARLIYNNHDLTIFIEPGDEMQVNVGPDSLYNPISFSGKGSVQNEFLLSFNKTFSSDFDKDGVAATILNSDADAFEMSLFDERKKQLQFFNSYKDKNSFSESFNKYIESTIRYNYYSTLLSYPIIQANQSAQILTVRAFPPVMLQGIDSKLIFDEALNCDQYRDFLYYYAIYFASEANGFNKFKDQSLSMESKILVAGKNFSGQSLNWYIASFLNSDIQKVSPYTAGHIYSILSTTENNGVYTKLLKKKVEARLAQKEVATDPAAPSKGSASIYPKLKDTEGKYFTIDDLKGKVIYVDFWASWCGPCRQQMPFSKQLHDMFDEKQMKQVEFLYISIDQSEEAWKNAIKQMGMEGKHGISPGNWQSEIAKYFQIISIPRYMLIDKKGNIVDLNAKRPSLAQEVYNDILKLLE